MDTQVPRSMPAMRCFVNQNNMTVATVGAGRTKDVVRNEVISQLSTRSLRARTSGAADVSSATRRGEVKRCLETAGVIVGAESAEHISRLTEKRASTILQDFERMSGWCDAKGVQRKVALHLRASIRYPLHDKDVVPMVRSNIAEAPWTLEHFGCTLRDVDRLFRSNGWWTVGDASRTRYHLTRLLAQEIAARKNTCVSRRSVIAFCIDHEIREQEAADCVAAMIEMGSVVSFDDERFISTRTHYECERTICDAFIVEEEVPLLCPCVGTDAHTRTPTEEQRRAIEAFATHRIVLLVGPGGCGKSDVCLRGMMRVAVENGLCVTLLGPTHVVRKLLDNLVDDRFKDVVHAQTLASLLREPTSAEAGVYVLDEASMVDSLDMSKLMERAAAERSRLVLCGDPDQLRPIGAGSPFVDLVAHCRRGGDARLCEVTRVFRAESATLASFSNIYRSHKIADEWGEFWSFKAASGNKIGDRCKDVLRTYFTDGDDDEIEVQFQVACNDYKSIGAEEHQILCVTATNEMCVRLHKIKRAVFRGVVSDVALKHADQCVFLKNTKYFKNGDGGIINDVFAHPVPPRRCRYYTVIYMPEEEEVDLLIDELRKPKHSRSNVDIEFVHTQPHALSDGRWMICVAEDRLCVGGCVTVHKAQGRGEQFCIVTATNGARHMTRSDWAYTGVSRAKRGVSLVGALKVFNQHARPRQNPPRDTILHRLLKNEPPQPLPPVVDEHSTAPPAAVIDLQEDRRAEIDAGKTRRKKIRKAVRDAVWRRDCHKTPDGQCLVTATCCCCAVEIDKDRFHCAHVESVFHGGTDASDNLRLCCSACNESMGTLDLRAFQTLCAR